MAEIFEVQPVYQSKSGKTPAVHAGFVDHAGQRHIDVRVWLDPVRTGQIGGCKVVRVPASCLAEMRSALEALDKALATMPPPQLPQPEPERNWSAVGVES